MALRHVGHGLPADERLVSLGRSGPGGRSGFFETRRTRCGGVFLACAQTAFQSAFSRASTRRVRHRSERVEQGEVEPYERLTEKSAGAPRLNRRRARGDSARRFEQAGVRLPKNR